MAYLEQGFHHGHIGESVENLVVGESVHQADIVSEDRCGHPCPICSGSCQYDFNHWGGHRCDDVGHGY